MFYFVQIKYITHLLSVNKPKGDYLRVCSEIRLYYLCSRYIFVHTTLFLPGCIFVFGLVAHMTLKKAIKHS